MQTLIIHFENKKTKVIKTLLKALDVNFENKEEETLSIIIEKGKEDKRLGRLKTIKLDDVWKLN
jgi:hypothetical protein